MAELEDAVQSFDRADYDLLMAGLVVAVTLEAAFLADPSAAVWTPMFAPDREESLLPAETVSVRPSGDTDSGLTTSTHT
ncbi:MAG: hypothetical protein OXG33_11215 [Chloroflexi bacterium]|nr:hypothetical protein [Chloroflexota bacterium]